MGKQITVGQLIEEQIIMTISKAMITYIGITSKISRPILSAYTTILFILPWEGVLGNGLNLVVLNPSDRKGSEARIVLLPSRVKRWGLYHIT